MNIDKKNKPIGVFDSGIGGLTVLKEILKVLPNESTIYLGDTARVPYGIRSPETVIRYSFENTKFLSSKDIKLLVIACNTASSISLGAIERNIDIPVIGVIKPGAKAAAKATRFVKEDSLELGEAEEAVETTTKENKTLDKKNILKLGEIVKVEITRLDQTEGKIYLSRKE